MKRILRWALMLVGFFVVVGAIARLVWPDQPTSPVIGVIHVEGTIGEAGDRWERSGASTEEILEQIEEARKHPGVKAVVVRIESPGGSPAAAQEIHSALRRLRSEGRPVVASLGDLATSAGYYIALAAERIVANPATATGSIGVVMQVINLEPLLDRWGVEVEVLTSGPHKAATHPFEPLTPAQREALTNTLHDLHEQFVQAVADGRGLTVEQVRELADGRIFSGRQALDLGLVDELGGLEDSIRLASQLADLEEVPPVIRFRRVPGWWQRLLNPLASPVLSWLRGLASSPGWQHTPAPLFPGSLPPQRIHIHW